jgi:hypothetical protein
MATMLSRLRGSRIPTFQARPQRSPMTRASPPALTRAFSTPVSRRISIERSTA